MSEGADRCHICIHLLPSWSWGSRVPFFLYPSSGLLVPVEASSPHTAALVLECFTPNAPLLDRQVLHIASQLWAVLSQPQHVTTTAFFSTDDRHVQPTERPLECLALVSSGDCVSGSYGSEIIRETVLCTLPSLGVEQTAD